MGAFNVVPRELPGAAIQQNDQRDLNGAFPNGQMPAFILPTTTAMPSVAQPTTIPALVTQSGPIPAAVMPPQTAVVPQDGPRLMIQGLPETP